MSDLIKIPEFVQKYRATRVMYPDHLFAIQCGDFFEFLDEHAITAAKALQITLTARQKDSEAPIPMCGFPYYRLEADMQILTGKGYNVAVLLKDQGREVVRTYQRTQEVVITD